MRLFPFIEKFQITKFGQIVKKIHKRMNSKNKSVLRDFGKYIYVSSLIFLNKNKFYKKG